METHTLGRRERRKLKTRNDLKQATEDLLIEIGFDELNIQKITDRADLARATFYLHFGDIEEAVWAVLADRMEELGRVMWDVDETEPSRIRYAKWVNIFQFVQHHRPLMSTILGDKGHIKLVRRVNDLMAAMLQADLASGKVSRTTGLPLEFEAQFYTGAVMQIIVWWLGQENDYSAEALAGMVYEIVLRQPIK